MDHAEAIAELEKLRKEVEMEHREQRDIARAGGPAVWKEIQAIDQRFDRRLTAIAKACDALTLVDDGVEKWNL